MLEEIWDKFTDWLIYGVLCFVFTFVISSSLGKFINVGWLFVLYVLANLAAYKIAFLTTKK